MATKDETLKSDPEIGFLKVDLVEKKIFAKIFSKHNGNWSAIKSELTGKQGFRSD